MIGFKVFKTNTDPVPVRRVGCVVVWVSKHSSKFASRLKRITAQSESRFSDPFGSFAFCASNESFHCRRSPVRLPARQPASLPAYRKTDQRLQSIHSRRDDRTSKQASNRLSIRNQTETFTCEVSIGRIVIAEQTETFRRPWQRFLLTSHVL